VLLLVDAADAERRGGTAARADWQAAARLAAERPILLAGGISPANLVEAAMRVRPFGVDVSSGVESAPGVKDPEKMRDLFAAVPAADEQRTRVNAR
jgi:phosphoribosylanthranilate isomerase